MTSNELLQEIEGFLADHDMPPSRFGLLALNDREFVRRLRRGSDVRTKTIERVRQFMANEKQKAVA